MVLQRLVDAGNTVVVIEHNLDVVKCADWVIDLGPEGGAKGGDVVCAGTPEDVAKVARSYTGQLLKGLLAVRKARPKKSARRDEQQGTGDRRQAIQDGGPRSNSSCLAVPAACPCPCPLLLGHDALYRPNVSRRLRGPLTV